MVDLMSFGPSQHKNSFDSGLVFASLCLGALKQRAPDSERAANEILSLPMFAELTSDQIRAVCKGLAAARKSVGG